MREGIVSPGSHPAGHARAPCSDSINAGWAEVYHRRPLHTPGSRDPDGAVAAASRNGMPDFLRVHFLVRCLQLLTAVTLVYVLLGVEHFDVPLRDDNHLHLPVRSAALIEVGDALLLFLTIVYAEMKDGKVKRGFHLGVCVLRVTLQWAACASLFGHRSMWQENWRLRGANTIPEYPGAWCSAMFVLGAAGLVGLVEPFFHSFLGHLVTLTEGPADEVEYDIVVQDAAHMSAYQRLDDPYADEAKQ
ncbi:unnamed protein product, partial [Mesorhabditis spiculigera]